MLEDEIGDLNKSSAALLTERLLALFHPLEIRHVPGVHVAFIVCNHIMNLLTVFENWCSFLKCIINAVIVVLIAKSDW